MRLQPNWKTYKNQMIMEIQLISIIVQDGDIQENFTGMFPVSQSYLPAQKPKKRKKPRKERQTVAHLIDALLDNIDSLK